MSVREQEVVEPSKADGMRSDGSEQVPANSSARLGVRTRARWPMLSPMTTAYFSSLLEHPITEVWSLIRDFNNYPAYIEGVTESVIEDEKAGDEIGAVRRFFYGGSWIRQRLDAHSDEQRSLTYVGMDPFTFPPGIVDVTPAPARYEGTIHLLPLVDGNRTFIEWSVTLDARSNEAEQWRNLLLSLISSWIDSLRRTLAGLPQREAREHDVHRH